MEKKTGTTTVGIRTKEGVVLAADTQASLDHMVETLNIRKILPITDRIAITTAGSVGDVRPSRGCWRPRRGTTSSRGAGP